jgi:BirA family biotin operon repressor/biotin-[acetyl-CoA-carboxylase] ligase
MTGLFIARDATSPQALPSFDLVALKASLQGTPFHERIHHFAQIDSTNTHAMREAAAGAPEGSVYIADSQTAGRGRGAHNWVSPPGSGLYVSILLRPALSPGDALWLSLAAGLASQSAIATVTGLHADLRWPNDLLVGSKKLGGILTELQAEATRVRFVVIGIGINVHQIAFPPALANSATSLAIESPGTSIDRTNLLAALLPALQDEVSRLAVAAPAEAQQSLIRRLEAGSTWVHGKLVTVGEESPFSGVTEGLDARGFLRVRTDSGELRTVLSGGVRAQESLQNAAHG